MRLKEHSTAVVGNEVHYSLVSQSGHLLQPIAMGIGAARELAEELLLTIHQHERAEREAEVVNRMIENAPSALSLTDRERECMEAIHGTSDCEMCS